MPSVLAIVSKAIFERDAKIGGRVAAAGEVVALDCYVSKNKGLAPVGEGGALFLVTVRPPDERLWLVAILESPAFDGESWKAAKNLLPIRDVSDLKDKLKFTSGTGITAKVGALGMSLQTPRVLTDADVALLRGASAPSTASRASKAIHLNAHEPGGAVPCLCKKCLPLAPEQITIGALELARERAEANGFFLWFWLPKSLEHDRDALRRSVASRLHRRGRRRGPSSSKANLDTAFAGQGAGDDE